MCLDVVVPRSAALTVRSLLCVHERRADRHRRPPRGLWLLHLPGHQRGRKCADQGAAGGGGRWVFTGSLQPGEGWVFILYHQLMRGKHEFLSRCTAIRKLKKEHNQRPHLGRTMNFLCNVLFQQRLSPRFELFCFAFHATYFILPTEHLNMFSPFALSTLQNKFIFTFLQLTRREMTCLTYAFTLPSHRQALQVVYRRSFAKVRPIRPYLGVRRRSCTAV